MKPPKLIIFDLDNSCFDWLKFFGPSVVAALKHVSETTKIDYQTLCDEYKQIITNEDSIEYPFVIQQLPSILEYYNHDVDRILTECSEPAREQLKLAAYPYLKPYPGVIQTLQTIRQKYPETKLAILTDAPRRIAFWRLYRLGILNYFDGIYGAEDPKLPVIDNKIFVTKQMVIKNLDRWFYGYIGRHQELPNVYRKPSTKGLKYVLTDLDIEIEDKSDVFFAGDNVYKDIKAAEDFGKLTSVWLRFGVDVDLDSVELLKQFAPDHFIHKGISPTGDFPKADHVIDEFSDILKLIE